MARPKKNLADQTAWAKYVQGILDEYDMRPTDLAAALGGFDANTVARWAKGEVMPATGHQDAIRDKMGRCLELFRAFVDQRDGPRKRTRK